MMPTVEILPYTGCQKENLNSKVSKISRIITTVPRYLISQALLSDTVDGKDRETLLWCPRSLALYQMLHKITGKIIRKVEELRAQLTSRISLY